MVRSPSYGFHQNASKGQQLALLHMTLIRTQGKGCESHFKITSIDVFVIFRWKSMPHEAFKIPKVVILHKTPPERYSDKRF